MQPPVPPCIPRGSASRALRGSWYQDLGTKILVPRSWYQDLGTRILVPGSWYQDLGTRMGSQKNNFLWAHQVTSMPLAAFYENVARPQLLCGFLLCVSTSCVALASHDRLPATHIFAFRLLNMVLSNLYRRYNCNDPL